MRRRRHIKRDTYSSEILLAEFRFYNKRKKAIDDTILVDISKKLKTGIKDCINWTNKTFADSGVGFKFRKVGKDIFIEMIDFGTKFAVTDFTKSKDIFFDSLFIHFDMTEEQKDILIDIRENTNISNKDLDCKKFFSWNELVNYLILNNLITIRQGKGYWKDYKEAFKTLFDDDIEEPYYKEIGSNHWDHKQSYHIFKVLEKRINDKNYRIVAIYDIYNSNYIINIIPEDDKYYNQYDITRLYVIVETEEEEENKRLFFIPQELNEYVLENENIYVSDGDKYIDVEQKKLIINKNLLKAIRNNILEIVDAKEQLITPIIYNFYKERVVTFNDYDSNNLSYVEQKIIDKYLQILNQGKEIKINQVCITKNSIVIDKMFGIKFDDSFLKIAEVLVKLRNTLKDDNIRYNFNSLYEHLLDLSGIRSYYRDNDFTGFEAITFTVNNVEIHIERDGRRMKINDIFCRVSDIIYVLGKAVCYNSTDEYNQYMKDISHIGMEWKRIINNGVLIELSNPLGKSFEKIGLDCDYTLKLRFSFLWDATKRSNVCLMLNNNKYLIKYKGKFKQHFNSVKNYMNISEIKSILDECVENLDDDTLIEIVENAIKEAEIIKTRGEELVRETIVDVNAIETTITVDKTEHHGYTVIGIKTKTKYFIKKQGLDVYKFEDGSWNRRCVVDDHNKNRIYEDRLANRLVNIFNEPKKIYTLFNT